MARVLVVNSGSSSLKYQVLDGSAAAGAAPLRRLARAQVQIIGPVQNGLSDEVESVHELADPNAPESADAIRQLCAALVDDGLLADLDVVGHRVVHGAAEFTQPVVVDAAVERQLDELSILAPLHNPPALAAIRAVRTELPGVPQVAVFDTAFHATLPPHAYTYAIPRELAGRHGVRRYGFHGTSVRYVVRAAAGALGVPVERANLIVCHLGNGASVTAVEGGRSVDTSMGLTPLEGLVMGTRSGDIDPAIVAYLDRAAGMRTAEVEHLLEFESGLLGLAGDSDVRGVRRRVDAGEENARLALDVYAYRLRKYVGAYLAVLPSVNGVVFTGGVGEHDANLRVEVIEPLGHLGLRLDDAVNTAAIAPTSAVRVDDGKGTAILVVPTDEEAEIAQQVLQTVGM
jgi:acetate kinase